MKTKIQTTYPAEAANYATRHPLAKPLYGFVIVDGHTCAVEQCSANDEVQFEVLSPDGYHFDEGTHIFCCYSIKDLKERCDGAHVEPCEDDCDCMIEAVKKGQEMLDSLVDKKTDYNVGDRVRLLSVSGMTDEEVPKRVLDLEFLVQRLAGMTTTTDFAHDLLVVNVDEDLSFWVDFKDVTKLSRFGWIDGYVRKGEHVVEISGVPLSPKPSQSVFNHSPDGFNWGYQGSGPTQLALAILLQYGSQQFAVRYYHDFLTDVLMKKAQCADSGFALHSSVVLDYIKNNSNAHHIKKDSQPSDKLWCLVVSDLCECDKCDPVVPVYEHEACECQVSGTHLHCYCGGRLD